jgi:(1->4)-alpha-D-glucan 1-alpha-D-glucosylmutase
MHTWTNFQPVFQKSPLLPAPTSAYRIQLTPAFTLDDLVAIVPLLAERGINAVYLSPITTPQLGSENGYNVIDHDLINPELGGEKAFTNLVNTLKRSEMGAILDIVPNHMSIENGKNPWWQDILKHGSNSQYAEYFDLFWEESAPPGKLNLSFLGAPLAEVIADGQLIIVADGDEAGYSFLAYGSNPYPINQLGTEKIRTALEERDLDTLNRDRDFLIAIHDLQYYQLNYWRQIGSINYSRFFAIDSLARLRVEEKQVFDAAHQGVMRWTQELAEAGVPVAWRIDHPDGLEDPAGYFQRVREALTAVVGADTIVIAEKILGDDETLPDEWYEHGVMGTVGYDFMKQANDLAISKPGLAKLQASYQRFTNDRGDDFDAIAAAASAVVLESKFDLQPEFERCARLLYLASGTTDDEICQRLRRALFALLVGFPVYRTYITELGTVSDRDRQYINQAIELATQAEPSISEELALIQELLLAPSSSLEVRNFVRYFQRISGPVKAKGFEDTALYRHVVAASLYEVGGNPARVHSVPEFHAAMVTRSQQFPYSFTSLSTHDTKRGLDTRMRAATLSFLAPEWEAWLNENVAANDRYDVAEVKLHRADVWLLYQTIVAAIPPEWVDDAPTPEAIDNYRQRITDYLFKALREAKERTYWVKPEGEEGTKCQAYEAAIEGYVRSIFADATFIDRLRTFGAQVAALSMRLGLAQVAIAATAPGIVEIYQGGFDWNTKLVDPDNRHPVDHAKAAEIKTAMMVKLLQERNLQPSAFVGGSYAPIEIAGISADAAISYRRSSEDTGYVIAIAIDPHEQISNVILTGLASDRAYVDIFTELTLHSDDKGNLPLDRLSGTLPLTVLRERSI